MRKMKVPGLWVMVGMLALLVSSCAKPPIEEKNAAQAAKDTAIAAEAEMYASAVLGEAQKVWDDAEAKMQSKAYKEAKAGYLAAKDAFEKAAAEVENAKKVLAEENQAVLKAVEKSWAELSKLMSKKVKKMKTAMKKEWTATSKKIQEMIKAAKAETNPLAMKKKLEEAKSTIEKTKAKVKK
jgi:hypothetical protein